MRRPVRALVVGVALLGALLLAACDKPVPSITIQTGSFSTTVTPVRYCFDTTHCRISTGVDLPVANAQPGSRVLVDVPRQVVAHGWAVIALSLDGKKRYGSSGVINDNHSYAVAASTNNGNPFLVVVQQLDRGRPDGSRWNFIVTVSQNT